MPPQEPNEIQQKIDALPSEIRDFIYSPDMNKLVQQIGTKNQLHVDQVGALETEIVAAMIGISPLEKLSENIADTLSIDKLRSDAVVKDINELILSKVRSSMMQADAKAEAPKAPSVPPAIANIPKTPSAPSPMMATPAGEKSVVMPSAAKAASTPIADIKPPMPASSTVPAVSQPPVAAPKPATPAVASAGEVGPISKPISAQPTPAILIPAKPAAVPPVVATVAPTTPTAPKVDAMLTQPTVSAAPKQPVVIPDAKPAAPVVPAAAPATPPPPPAAHKVDPYREPID